MRRNRRIATPLLYRRRDKRAATTHFRRTFDASVVRCSYHATEYASNLTLASGSAAWRSQF